MKPLFLFIVRFAKSELYTDLHRFIVKGLQIETAAFSLVVLY